MTRIQKLFIAVTTTLVFALTGTAWADAPAEIQLDQVPGKKGAVKFPHATHTTAKKADGAAIGCKDCHHTLATNAPARPDDVKACVSCHVKPGEALKQTDGKDAPALATVEGDKVDLKSLLAHKQCLECHKSIKDKKIAGCKTCH